MVTPQEIRIPICLASDNNYLQHLAVTMASILKNKNESDQICFYILEQSFSEKDKETLNQLRSIADFKIHYINVNNSILDICPIQTYKDDYLSIAAYFRLFIPELIPQEDKIIYLDCDIVVCHSLSELFQMEFKDEYLLGVRDIDSRGNCRRMKTKRYINSGVLLMNAKKMREDKIQERFIKFIIEEKKRIIWHDQDVIAGTLDGYIGYISPKWNGQIGRLPKNLKYSRLNDAYILHYIGDKKPWLPFKDAQFIDEYFKYLRLTPFADFEKKYKQKRTLWKMHQSFISLGKCIFSKETSPLRTYNTFRFLGIPFRQKRKQRKRN